MKKNILFGLMIAGSSLFASEPFLLKNPPKDQALSNPVFPKKRAKNFNDQPNIAIKMNLTQLAYKNLSFMGEYGFHNKMSVGLGMSFLMERDLSGLLYTEDEFFSTPKYKGMTITPEFRFYPGGKDEKCAPKGFYLAAYFRYAKYVLSQEVSYQETSSSPIYTGTGEHTLKATTAGLMIGYQWIVAKHFNIDFWILGGGFGKAKYEYTWSCPQANLTPAQQADLKQEYLNYFDGVAALGGDLAVTTTPKSATASASGLPFYSIRLLGLCLGYAF